MRKDGTKGYTIRIDEQLLHKLHVISAYEGRSANSQIIQLMLRFIADYEKEHGKINMDDIKR